MKKILYATLGVLLLFNLSCKKDFLNPTALSKVDTDFVFSSPEEAYKSIVGCYDIWRGAVGGAFYDIDEVGSDAECHPEAYDAQLRHIPEGLYASEIPIDYSTSSNLFLNLYKLCNRANIIMEAISKNKDYQDAVKNNTVSKWTQLYGEAATFRAYSYFYLIKYFGDVQHFNEPVYTNEQADTAKLMSRDKIYDIEIANLEKVAPLMNKIGEGGINAERFSRTFAEALIGKMALYAGGYSLRRTNFDYGNVTFEKIGTDKWDAQYVRRSDYKTYYAKAETYLKKASGEDAGSAKLITIDGRGAGFNNPFQRNFQYNMDLQVSPESLYEVGITRAVKESEFPYAFGRPSGGGSKNAFPCKSYGQSRLYPAFYYGDYDPTDLRRDVTVTVTANSGSCSERLISFTPGSREKGGLANNKWDESRMTDPYTLAQRNSGINWTQMRMADVILMLAEVQAELGNEGGAKGELAKVRGRAFSSADQALKVTAYIAGLSGDALKEAILQERKLELAGEGLRRYDLIRTGKFPAKIKAVRDQQIAMVNGLETNGYYTFPNGNTISNYIYVKAVNVASLGMTKMLTTNTEVASADPTYPVKFPGWRGNCDLWPQFSNASGNRNLAIKGLFRYIDPAGTEAATLIAEGYKKTNWGKDIVDNKAQYTSNVFKGYPDAYFAGGVPPRYLFPFSSATIAKSNGLITNGYGFAQN